MTAIIYNSVSPDGFFNNPSDSYLFGVVAAFMERMTTERIPNLKHKIYYVVLTNIGRFLIISPKNNILYITNLAAICLGIVMDIDKEGVIKNLFFSYANEKNSFTKFKDLVVQDIPEGVLIISKDLSRNLFVNNAFKEVAGCKTLANMKQCLSKFKIQEKKNDSNQAYSLLDLLEKNISFVQQKFSINLWFHDDNPSLITSGRIFEAKIFSIIWDSEPCIALTMHDITQQQTILSLQLADTNKDKVLATVSHELRTPLNGMLGMIQIMQKRVQDLEILHYLSICKNSGNLLLGLVNSILDLNQIRLNKLKLNIARVSLGELLNDIVHMFELQCTQKGLYLRLQIHKTCPQYIVTDKNRLTQVFINLVGNALKFTSEGGITISVEQDPVNTEHLRFAIEDTGIGIKDDDQGKLFKMFGKLEHGDNNHGVGLGLTISNSLVELLACCCSSSQHIKVSSTYGKGSKLEFSIKKELEFSCETEDVDEKAREFEDITEIGDRVEKMEKYSTPTINNFSVLKNSNLPTCNLPKNFTECEIATNASTTLSPKPKYLRSQSTLSVVKSNLSLRSVSKKTSAVLSSDFVLLVDDNPFNLVVAEQFVSSHGFKVKTALSGHAAIKIIMENEHGKEPIKLIFMDLQMPVMDGYETTKALKKLMKEEKIPSIPIVALTANDGPSDKKKCLDVGMSGHLGKPLKDVDLEIMLKKFAS